ncbi:hypothetical protein BU23DRAFT_568555 [Bimuria novae-zelandiae CBS 107.79]|uniref:Uncharacterized protein n=1 Tax=Bimuria novae-zelandiae CBS 107.79 TaxID=1447943 RepID=A0A6A5V8M2_9PLEO|nr:hypothetical protein BU23DRAFT_568555 [Bimuria novae-zelandiae CBS 107.79]
MWQCIRVFALKASSISLLQSLVVVLHFAMAGPPIPAITKRAPTIDFIDQRLSKHHPLFASHAAQYDPMSKQFVPCGQASGANTSGALTRGGLVGKIRKVRRQAADNITPGAEAAKIASKVVLQDNVATPVVGAVEVILDAFKASAMVRNQVLNGFDDIVSIFSDVELFLTTFQSKEFARGAMALFSGADYQKDLTDSLEMIQTKSGNLKQQADKSHIFVSQVSHAQLHSKVDMAVNETNSINYLLNDHLQEKERHLQQVQRELEAARQENVHLRVENGILRSTSPERISTWPPSQQRIQGPAQYWYVSQSTLRQMIDTFDVDFVDERSRAEQIIKTPLLRNWIVSASSAKLLVHWDTRLPKTFAGVSPLSVFCMTLAHFLRAKDHFISAVWFCGQHTDADEPDALIGGCGMLSSIIDQLLRQFQFDTVPLHNNIDLERLQEGDISALSELLVVLTRQLPLTMTLFLIVDCVALFEREEFAEEASQAFLSFNHLVSDPSVMAAVKLLFTSTPGTDVVRVTFEQDDLILNVDSLPVLAATSEERMIRELGDLNDDETP